ncbi:MAG: hypothetical protein IMZ66_09565, partial [Planctomycetes bacterium]|nr:hypothetical protein [Planctomycetota bacterium]
MCRAVLVLAAVLAVSVTVQSGRAVAETPDEEAALRPYVPPPAPRPADWPRERLAAFMRELAGFVYEHHVVRDESRKTYGMTYEFYADGKWMQEFGLDSMHDGAWFMSAMATAH